MNKTVEDKTFREWLDFVLDKKIEESRKEDEKWKPKAK